MACYAFKSTNVLCLISTPKVILIAMKMQVYISGYMVGLNQFALNHPVVRVASIFMTINHIVRICMARVNYITHKYIQCIHTYVWRLPFAFFLQLEKIERLFRYIVSIVSINFSQVEVKGHARDRHKSYAKEDV